MKKPAKREALSRDRILRAALGIVDREGLDAISMRRLGEELGVEAMSLYNHVPNKAAILDGLLEIVLAELPIPKKSASWQGALRDRARMLRAVFHSHPNALSIFATRPAVTPRSIAHIESVFDVLRTAGFSVADALSTLQVLLAFVVGHTLAAYSQRGPDEVSQPEYERLSQKDFPRVREAARLLPTHDIEREFEFGLDAMLVGIEARCVHKRRARS
jgi:AcrR family transcriptional regulator